MDRSEIAWLQKIESEIGWLQRIEREIHDDKIAFAKVAIRLEDVATALSKIASRLEEIKYEKVPTSDLRGSRRSNMDQRTTKK